jgi:NitT/TauT family transport system permease protein
MNNALQKFSFTLSPPAPRFARLRHSFRWWAPLLTVACVLALWQAATVFAWLPAFILPSPSEVFDKWTAVIESGMLQRHTLVTLQEMTLGLMWGVAIGSVLGYLIAHNRYLEAALSPLIVAFQATPVVAYAPLLIIWFGNGMTSKVVTCAIIVFFPTLINTIIGIRSVPAGWHDVFRSMQATRWQRLLLLELPAALPVFLAGLKTSATLALIGAVVGEFVSAREGLGYMVTLARNQFDTPLVFVGVFTMTALALSFYSAVSVMERVLLRWQRVRNQSK